LVEILKGKDYAELEHSLTLTL